MPKKNKAPQPQFDTTNTLSKTLTEVAEGLTGIASSERKDWLLSFGHILQSIRGERLLGAFAKEWKAYRDKGKVKEDYSTSEQHQECLQELLDFLDEGPPDTSRFSALKKILLVAATETASTRVSVLPQQYMKICRGLTSGELLVLLTAYNVSKAPPSMKLDKPELSTVWLDAVANTSGLGYHELVEIHERALIQKNLLTPRLYPDGSGVTMGSHFRLTRLAYDMCVYIERYEEVVAA